MLNCCLAVLHAVSYPLCAQAYQLLKRGGLSDDHIVVMHADDLAYDIQNPHAGKLFNKPGGPDVYAGLPKVARFGRGLGLMSTYRRFCWLLLN